MIMQSAVVAPKVSNLLASLVLDLDWAKFARWVEDIFDILKGFRNFTMVVSLPKVQGVYVEAVTVYFSSIIPDEGVKKAMRYLANRVNPQLSSVIQGGSTSMHAERLMVSLLQGLDAENVLDWNQEIPGMVINNGFCRTCWREAPDKNPEKDETYWPINTDREISLRLWDNWSYPPTWSVRGRS